MNLNQRSCRLIKELMDEYDPRVMVHETSRGKVFVLDFGVGGDFPQQVGVKLAEACMGCLGRVSLRDDVIEVVISERPSVAAMSCQMAGWCINVDGVNALGSGPARILAKKPSSIIEKIGYVEESREAVLLLESGVYPSEEVCGSILEETDAEILHMPVFSEASTAGLINIMARVAEMGVFRLFNLGFDVNKIRYAEGCCTLPVLDDDIMYSSNDALIYGGRVRIRVSEWDPSLTEKAVSSSSRFYGKSFQELYEKAGGDFYRIDPDIFAPAVLEVEELSSGEIYKAGEIRR